MIKDFYMGDLYPDMGHYSTRIATVPEPADQVALTDNQKQAVANPLDVAPEKSRSILMSIGIVFLVVVMLGSRF
jgi:hypothetical protein